MKIYKSDLWKALLGMVPFLTTLYAYADTWPIFSSPDLGLLVALRDIDTTTCPSGQGKLVDHASINIKSYSCKNFCPSSWDWVTQSDGACHDLTSGFEVEATDIAYFNGNDGTTSYSQISVYYGKKTTHKSSNKNKIVFTSQPGDHWFCAEIDPQVHHFSCASDI